uniref:Uncharacterized protein n=1 Tax=Anolis carolinensis TaxID=28377 RepID=A0A803SLH1_ANOCA
FQFPGIPRDILLGTLNIQQCSINSHSLFFKQTFHTPSLGDEEFEIPPITPPPELDPTSLGMADILLPFQGLSDQLAAQGNENVAPWTESNFLTISSHCLPTCMKK